MLSVLQATYTKIQAPSKMLRKYPVEWDRVSQNLVSDNLQHVCEIFFVLMQSEKSLYSNMRFGARKSPLKKLILVIESLWESCSMFTLLFL